MNKSKTSAPVTNTNTTSGKGAPPAKVQVKSSPKDRISESDYNLLKETFDIFDEDGSGTIDPVEIDGILDELGLKGRSEIVFHMIEGLRTVNRPLKFDEFLDIICSKVGDCKSRDGITRVF